MVAVRSLSCVVLLILVTACGNVEIKRSIDTEKCVIDSKIQSFDGTQLVADCYPGSGPAVLFIHGAFQSRVVWTPQVQSLAGRYQLVTYDLRGHGESDRPQLDVAFNRPGIPGRDVEAILDHLGVEQVVLVGWSFGSIVASDAAVQLGAPRVAGIVLVSGTIESNTDRNRENFGSLVDEVAAMQKSGGDSAFLESTRTFIADSYVSGAWDPDLFDLVLAANMSLSPDERARVVQRPPYRYASELNTLDIPVLLIHGDADNVFRIDSSVAAGDDLINSTFLRYEGTGHWPFLEMSDRFTRDLTAFVESVR